MGGCHLLDTNAVKSWVHAPHHDDVLANGGIDPPIFSSVLDEGDWSICQICLLLGYCEGNSVSLPLWAFGIWGKK
jgi:hypothetical protein